MNVINWILKFIVYIILACFILAGIAFGVLLFGWMIIWVIGFISAIAIVVGFILLIAKIFDK